MIIRSSFLKSIAVFFAALFIIATAGYYCDAFCAGKVLNVATVRYRDAHGNVQDPVSASAETPISDGPNVKVTVTSDSEIAAVGSVITYRVTYQNTGNQDATDLRIDSIISGYVVFNEASGGGVFDPAASGSGTVSWLVRTVKPGEKGVLTLTVTVKKPTDYDAADPLKIKDGDRIVNTVKSVSNEKRYEDTYVITVGEAPLLKISVTQSADVLKPGDTFLYTVKFENAGNVRATNVIVKDEVPELTSFVDGSITNPVSVPRAASNAPPPAVGTGRIDGRTLIWNIGILGPNQAGTVSFRVRLSTLARRGQQVLNMAVISGSEQFAVSSNRVVAEIVNDFSAAITLNSSSERVVSGDLLTYTMNITNNGSENLTSLIVKNKVPANVSFVSAADGGRLTGASVVWTLPALAPGATRVLSFQARVSDRAVPGDVIADSVTLNSPDLPGLVEAAKNIAVVDVAALSDLTIAMTSNKNTVFIGETVRFTITLENKGAITVSGVKLQDVLPAGLEFVRGSVISGGRNGNDPAISSGGRLDWPIPDMTPGAAVTLNFLARVGAGIAAGTVSNSARVTGTYLGRALSSKTVTAKVRIAEGVFSSKGIILGKVFFDADGDGMQSNDPRNGKTSEIGIAGAKLLLEDGSYVETDGNGKFSIYNVSPGTHVLRLDLSSLPPGLRPVPVSGRNSGRGDSIFVDLGQSMIFTADFVVTGNISALESAPKNGGEGPKPAAVTAAPSLTQAAGTIAGSKEPEYFKNIASMTPETDFVNPKNGETVSSGNIAVVAKTSKDLIVKLIVNGAEVPPDRIGRRSVNAAAGVAVYEFIGVPLRPGFNNTLKLYASDPFGNVRGTKEITVKTVGEPSRISIKAIKNHAPADGKSLTELIVGFYDGEGNRVSNPGRVTVDCGMGEIKNPDEDSAAPGTQIMISGDSSPVIIVSPRESGRPTVTVSYNGMETSCDINFVPELKNPVTLGIGEFKIGKGSVSGFERRLPFDDYFSGGTYRGARGAFFTKGKLGRDMQLTASYDTHKVRQDELFRQSDTDVNAEDKYPIFGDESRTGYEAMSREKLYLRLDRKMSTLLYGDYYTDLKDNMLAAYNRMFNGARLVMNEGRFGLNSFVSHTNKTQVVDKFRGRGISGFYNLTNSRITPGSEFVVIETRYRFQPDIVLKREVKVREQDYTVDYDLGFVLFKSEVPSTDGGFNPVFLIVSYEAENLDQNYYIYGGRGSVKLGRIVELGVTDVRERQIAGDYRLNGVDLIFRGKKSSLKLEWAKTGSMTMVDNVLSPVGDKGFAAELTGNPGGRLSYKGYFKTAGDYFYNPSAYDIMSGTRRVSFDASYRLEKNSSLRGSYFKQNDMLNSMYYEHAALGVEKTFYKTKLSLDLVKEKSTDKFIPVTQLRTRHPFDISEQTPNDLTAAELNIERPLNKRTSVSARSKFDIAHNAYNISMAGIDYKLAGFTKLYLRGERAKFDDETDRRLVLGAESDVMRNTTAFSEYRIGDGSTGERLQKSIGLRNRFELGPKVTGNFSIEKLDTLRGPELLQEPDAFAFATGVEYLPMERLKVTGRFEKRKASIEDSYLSELGAAYGVNSSVSLLFRERLFRNWQTAVGKSSSLRTSLGVAYRPVYFDRFNALLRLELKENLNPSAVNGFDDNAIIYSLEGTYRTNPKLQLSGKYAAKKDRDAVFGGLTDLLAGKFILDISRRFDFGVEYRVMDSRASNTKVKGALFEFGYRVKDDIWLSVGHSMQKFDSDLTGDNFDGKGPYAKVRFKFDEGLFRRRSSK